METTPVHQAEIAIAGGGLAGLIATAVFAAKGFKTLCIAPVLPAAGAADKDADLRSTAFLEPAVALMADAGLWEPLAPHATDLAVMQLADADGTGLRYTADFAAADLGRARFGVNLPNWRTGAAIVAELARQPQATVLSGVSAVGLTTRDRSAILRLSDGAQVRASLVIAADGRDSTLRRLAGIDARRWDYGQQALVFAVSHPRPHNHTSTEIHRSGGPFTLVPLRDVDGVPHSAVVWMERGPEAARLMALDDTAFSAAATERSAGILGPLKVETARKTWPIASLIAERFDAPRLALAAEAAHAMPPIGAQGLNTSLADLRTLRDLISAARDEGTDIGAPPLLRRYSRARHPDAAMRVMGVDALNRAAIAGAPGFRALRRAGLRVLSETRPIKGTAMRLGLGA